MGDPSTRRTPAEDGRVTFTIEQGQQGFWFWYELHATVDGVKERIGRDGGEPEDQNLHRDWKWVKPALERFYALGVEHGRAAVSSPPADVIERARQAIEDRLITLNITDCEEHYNPATEMGCWDVMDYGAIARHVVGDLAEAGLLAVSSPEREAVIAAAKEWANEYVIAAIEGRPVPSLFINRLLNAVAAGLAAPEEGQ